MKLAVIPLALALAACGATQPPKPYTPPPEDIFTAEGHHNNPKDSATLAERAAIRTCRGWQATPGILTTETVDLRTGAKPGEAAKDMAARAMTTGRLFKKDLPIRTTITYKCYP